MITLLDATVDDVLAACGRLSAAGALVGGAVPSAQAASSVHEASSVHRESSAHGESSVHRASSVDPSFPDHPALPVDSASPDHPAFPDHQASTDQTAAAVCPTSGDVAALRHGAQALEGFGRSGPARRTTLEVEAAQQLVDPADREASARRQRPDDARRTLAGRVALRLLVAVRLGVPVSLAPQIVVDRTCSTCHLPHGRPRVAGLSVSTSSSEERVLVAVADEGSEVGVDIERVPPTVFEGFDDFVLHPDERERFGPVTRGPAGTAARLSCWVEKEAVLKAVGVGLASPPHELLLSARPDDAVLLTRADMIGPWEWRLVERAGASEALGLSVTELPTEPGYRSAIAARVPARIHAVDIASIATQIASSEGLRA